MFFTVTVAVSYRRPTMEKYGTFCVIVTYAALVLPSTVVCAVKYMGGVPALASHMPGTAASVTLIPSTASPSCTTVCCIAVGKSSRCTAAVAARSAEHYNVRCVLSRSPVPIDISTARSTAMIKVVVIMLTMLHRWLRSSAAR